MIRSVTVIQQGHAVNTVATHADLDKVSVALSEIQLSENISKENREPPCASQYFMSHGSVENEAIKNESTIAYKSDCFQNELSAVGFNLNNSAIKKTSSDEDKGEDCIDDDNDQDWIDIEEEGDLYESSSINSLAKIHNKKINSHDSSSIDPRLNAKINAAAKKLNKLLNLRKSFLCRKCGKSYHKKKHLIRHERSHLKGVGLVQKVKICYVCEKMCAGIHEYKVHRLLGCVCDSVSHMLSQPVDNVNKRNYFSGKSSAVLNCVDFLEIDQTCSGGGTRKCGICGASFISKKDLHQHYATHQNLYACTLCGKAGFSSRNDARAHILSQHGIKSRSHHHHHKKTSNNVPTQKACRESTRKFRKKVMSCKKCKMTFTEKKSLTKHRIKMHPRKKNNFKPDLEEGSL